MAIFIFIVIASIITQPVVSVCSPDMKDKSTCTDNGTCFNAESDTEPCKQSAAKNRLQKMKSGETRAAVLTLEDKEDRGIYGQCGAGVSSPSAVRKPPTVHFPAADRDKKYMLIMVDPDAPSRTHPTARYFLHWLITDIKGSDLRKGADLKSSKGQLKSYYPPGPPPHTGAHRYQFFLFQLPDDFMAADVPAKRGRFNLNDFVNLHKICDNFVAGFEYKVSHDN